MSDDENTFLGRHRAHDGLPTLPMTKVEGVAKVSEGLQTLSMTKVVASEVEKGLKTVPMTPVQTPAQAPANTTPGNNQGGKK